MLNDDNPLSCNGKIHVFFIKEKWKMLIFKGLKTEDTRTKECKHYYKKIIAITSKCGENQSQFYVDKMQKSTKDDSLKQSHSEKHQIVGKNDQETWIKNRGTKDELFVHTLKNPIMYPQSLVYNKTRRRNTSLIESFWIW